MKHEKNISLQYFVTFCDPHQSFIFNSEVFYGQRWENEDRGIRAELKALLRKGHVSKEVQGEVKCSVDVFGDPIFTVAKHCVCQPSDQNSPSCFCFAEAVNHSKGTVTPSFPFFMYKKINHKYTVCIQNLTKRIKKK